MPGTLKMALLGLLDEAPSIVPIPTLPALLANGRGLGIVMVYAMQSFSQAATRWGPHQAASSPGTPILDRLP
jgi:type IV secretory pathway TraG/TraD family ATPase VirD4